MTKTEIATVIVAEAGTLMWKEAKPAGKMCMIIGLLEQLEAEQPAEAPGAAKAKVRKKRGPNKQKQAPLTKHAGATGQPEPSDEA